jgi:hypothetical protein
LEGRLKSTARTPRLEGIDQRARAAALLNEGEASSFEEASSAACA